MADRPEFPGMVVGLHGDFQTEEIGMVFNALFKIFMRVQIALFRMTKGRAMSAMRGMPVLLLTTVGRKTGKRRTTPLMYIRDGERYVITASNSGRDKHPAWLHNLQASPNVQIEIPGKRLEVSVSVATQSEREWLWPQLVAQAPFFDGYQKGTTRTIPMVMLKSR
jgi:deazaflavin-dependent oxidoreductase (nitroreductase family)